MVITESLIADTDNPNILVVEPDGLKSRARNEILIIYDKEDIRAYFAAGILALFGVVFLGLSVIYCIWSWGDANEITSILARIDKVKEASPYIPEVVKDTLNMTTENEEGM